MLTHADFDRKAPSTLNLNESNNCNKSITVDSTVADRDCDFADKYQVHGSKTIYCANVCTTLEENPSGHSHHMCIVDRYIDQTVKFPSDTLSHHL